MVGVARATAATGYGQLGKGRSDSSLHDLLSAVVSRLLVVLALTPMAACSRLPV